MKDGQRIAGAAAVEECSCEYGSVKFYALCGFGGVLSCGLTHIAVVPLDLVKCCMQVDPQKYKDISFCGLAKGWALTFIGYSLQGLCKFGFYAATCLERRSLSVAHITVFCSLCQC